MNTQFAKYATNTAFCVMLSKPQIKLLNSLLLKENSISQLDLLFHRRDVVIFSLMEKGLIENNNNRLSLTRPGELVCKLLDEADLLIHGKREILTSKEVERIRDSVK
jgi:hypothetical protein